MPSKQPVPFPVKKSIKKAQGYRCACCGKKYQYFVLEIHHVIPRSRGGSDKRSNLVALCSNCHKIVHHYLNKGMEVPLTYGNDVA